MIRNRLPRLALLGLVLSTPPAEASFHFMQIEQVIGGVCGDTSQQAIQLRMRLAGQQFVSQGRLRAWDAAGTNPVVLIDFGNDVTNGCVGCRVVSQSLQFATLQGPPEDFILTNVIPATYLPAGRLTFESDGGTVYWSLSWGGTAYTGSTVGVTTNDADGIFGPSFPGPLSWTKDRAIRFDGPAGDPSTNNAADYILNPTTSVFTNNNNTSTAIASGDCIFGDRFETGGPSGWDLTEPAP